MKTLATALAATLVLGLAPTLAIAACGHDRAAMSCADGTVYDQTTQRCVPATG